MTTQKMYDITTQFTISYKLTRFFGHFPSELGSKSAPAGARLTMAW